MKKKVLKFTTSLMMLFLFTNHVIAQRYSVGLAGGFGATNTGNVMFSRSFGFGANKKFFLAPAIRLGYASASTLDFISAPANITKEKSKIDTLSIANTGIIAANLALNIGYRFKDKFAVVFNIDLVGASFGSEQKSVFRPGEESRNQLITSRATTAKPTSTNVLLVGDNDIGTLTSALTLHYYLTKKVSVSLGAGFLFTEYKSALALGAANNDRFRYKSFQGVVGVNYYFY